MKAKIVSALVAMGLILSVYGIKQHYTVTKPDENGIESETGKTVNENSITELVEKEQFGEDSIIQLADKETLNEDGIIESVEKEQAEEEATKLNPSITESETKPVLEGIVICIDPGHGINSYNKQEAIAPNSSETKAAFASGTRGANQTEEQLNLKVAKMLEQKLKELGAEVYMTRTEAKSDMSNIDRAEFANNLNADISIRIHADGSSNSSVHGISMLVPTNDHINDRDLVEESERAGKLVLTEVIAQTGAADRGIIKRSDLTGFNWTKVPAILLEMGFMTNPDEDKLLETEEYQSKIVQGILEGLVKYFN